MVQTKSAGSWTLLLILAAVSGCGGDSASSNSGKWLEASEAQAMYAAFAKANAMMAAEGQPDFLNQPDATCEDILGDAKEAMKNPSSPGLGVIMRPCGNAGMAFGDDIRCKSGRLQVKCE